MSIFIKDIPLVFVLLLVFISSFILSTILNSILLKFAQTLGIRNESDVLSRWSNTSKPALGGLTFFIVFLLSIVFVNLFYDETWIGHFRFFGIILSLILAFTLGLFDDAYNTKPLIKFLTQLLCGLIMVVSGNYIVFFENMYLNYFLTIFWVVGMMNSINMLDNMDAITTIVTSVILILVLSIFIKFGFCNSSYFIIFLSLLAALLSFLYFNWHPSKMFMGDTGTQFLGMLLAIIGISFFWNGEDYYGQNDKLKQLTQVLLVFALPIIDTTTVFIKRIMRGTSPFVGGKDHTTHHLSYLGLSDRGVAFVFLGLGAFFAVLAYSLSFIQFFKSIHALIYSVTVFITFVVLFIIALKPPKNI